MFSSRISDVLFSNGIYNAFTQTMTGVFSLWCGKTSQKVQMYRIFIVTLVVDFLKYGRKGTLHLYSSSVLYQPCSVLIR